MKFTNGLPTMYFGKWDCLFLFYIQTDKGTKVANSIRKNSLLLNYESKSFRNQKIKMYFGVKGHLKGKQS